jgi:hypothetical protein
MSIVQVQRQPLEVTTSTSITPTLPGAPAVGNLIVCCLSSTNNTGALFTAATDAPNWTQKVHHALLNRPTDIWARIVQSGDPAAFTFNIGVSTSIQSYIAEYSGVDLSALASFPTTATDDTGGTVSSIVAGNPGDLTPFGNTYHIQYCNPSGTNGGSEAVDQGFTLTDPGSYSNVIVAEKAVSATSQAAPTFSWTTVRRAQTVGLVLKEAIGGNEFFCRADGQLRLITTSIA